jgi:hypothetical protein
LWIQIQNLSIDIPITTTIFTHKNEVDMVTEVGDTAGTTVATDTMTTRNVEVGDMVDMEVGATMVAMDMMTTRNEALVTLKVVTEVTEVGDTAGTMVAMDTMTTRNEVDTEVGDMDTMGTDAAGTMIKNETLTKITVITEAIGDTDTGTDTAGTTTRKET